MRLTSPSAQRGAAFSLIEVVIALGIATFCIIALIPLLSVALRNDKETRRLVDSSATASVLLQILRIAPQGAHEPEFPLPSIPDGSDVKESSAPILIDASGNKNAANPAFALTYRMRRVTSESDVCRIFLRLSTPPEAEKSINQTHFDLLSSLRVK